jgi:hypothetical protein
LTLRCDEAMRKRIHGALSGAIARGTHGLELAPHPRDLEIDYTAPSFLIPQKVRFRYRLDPLDRDWHDAGTRRRAFYTDLDPGKYTFRVMASNGDGVWNDAGATVAFQLLPHFYQTAWFRGLALVACAKGYCVTLVVPDKMSARVLIDFDRNGKRRDVRVFRYECSRPCSSQVRASLLRRANTGYGIATR